MPITPFRSTLLSILAAAAACSERPSGDDFGGSASGVVYATGTIEGVVVSAYAIDKERGVQEDNLLAESEPTGPDGEFLLELPYPTAVLLRARAKADQPARYVEQATGMTVTLSDEDQLETILDDWPEDDVDGGERITPITPWTTIGSSFARGLHATLYPDDFTAATRDAFSVLEQHFADGGAPIDLRTTDPADLTAVGEVTNVTAQARYGLLLAGLSQLADNQRVASSLSPATLTTLTLTSRLAADLAAKDGDAAPLFDGEDPAGAIEHGSVEGDSYWTRSDLSAALGAFLRDNPNNQSPFVESDVLELLEFMSADDNPRLYPDDGIPYDRFAPCADGTGHFQPEKCPFEAPTPTAGTPLRGTISLRFIAVDNSELSTATWVTPGVSNAALATNANRAGPWILTGELALDCAHEGPFDLSALVKDAARNQQVVTRKVVIDCTPPAVSVTSATAGGRPITEGSWTTEGQVSLRGSIADPYGVQQTSYSIGGGEPSPLPLSQDGTWQLEVALAEGANTVAINAVDRAGNAISLPLSYNRDTTPPTIADGQPASIINEHTYTVTTTPSTVSFGGSPASTEVQDGVQYSKFVTRYLNASSPNLPDWRFLVDDNHTQTGQVVFEFRIRQGTSLLVDWTPAPNLSGQGFNRSILIHGGLSSYLLNHSGTYTLELRATDELGNESPTVTRTWVQTLLSPPFYAAQASLSALNQDPTRVVTHYRLGEPPAGGAGNNFSRLVAGDFPGLPTVRTAAWEVANPNPVDIQFHVVSPTHTIRWSGRVRHEGVVLDNDVPLRFGCEADDFTGVRPQNFEGTSCFTPQENGDTLLGAGVTVTPALFFEVRNTTTGSSIPTIPNAGFIGVYRLPAGHRATFYLTTFGWSFLRYQGLDPTDLSIGDDPRSLTGIFGRRFRFCSAFSGNPARCTNQKTAQEVDFYREVFVTFENTRMQAFQTRLSTEGEGFVDGPTVAPGTSANITGRTQTLATAETGFPTPTSHDDF